MKRLYVLTLLLALPFMAAASIVYTDCGPSGLVVNMGDNLALDINTDGVTDFYLNSVAGELSIAPIFGYGCYSANANSVITAKLYTEGEEVNSTGYYEESERTRMYTAAGGVEAPYTNNEEFLIGYMVFNTYQYGWLRARFDYNIGQLIIIEYAYQSNQGHIDAGDRGNVGVNDVSPILAFVMGPNPATDAVTINYELFENAAATLAVFDMSGRAVMNAKLNASVGMQQEVLDVSNLKPGQYILRFESGEMIRQENFILTR
jgi:hypothetical protein